MDNPRLRNVLVVLGITVAAVWLLQVLGGLISQFGALVVTLLLAWIINLTALGPVRLLRRARVPRWLAALLVYLVIAGLVAVASFFVLPPLFGQIGIVAGQLTERAQEVPALLSNLDRQLVRLGVPADFVDELVKGASTQLVSFGQNVASVILNATGAVVGGLVLALLTLIISFYILMGWDANLRRIRAALPSAWRARFDRGLRASERAFGAWLGGQAVASTIWGGTVVLIYLIAGLPFGLLVGVVTGLFMFVPVVGIAVGIGVPLIMAVTVRIDLGIWVGISVTVLSLVIENVFKPRIMGAAIGVNPLVVIVSVIVGAVVAGFWGIVFGIPIGALLWTFARWSVAELLHAQREHRGEIGAVTPTAIEADESNLDEPAGGPGADGGEPTGGSGTDSGETPARPSARVRT